MKTTESEINEIRHFIDLLNAKKDSIVVVEGKRDSSALKELGYSGNICEFHRFKGLIKFADSVSSYKNLIVLFDGDKKGKYLTSKLISHLEHRTKIDLSFKRKIASITKGRIRHIEDLSRYCSQDRFVAV